MFSRSMHTVVFERVRQFSAEAGLQRAAIRREGFGTPIGIRGIVELDIALGLRSRLPVAGAHHYFMRVRRVLSPLKKRVSLEFFLYESREFEVGKLKKLDGLQKLRRHN